MNESSVKKGRFSASLALSLTVCSLVKWMRVWFKGNILAMFVEISLK